jgi:dTDP-4-dehydrorhamnose reductase
VDKAEEDLKQAYLVNAMGPYHLGLAARRHEARVIHFSTDYVFEGTKNAPYEENDVCCPLGAYGLSKLAGEMKLLEELEDACVIRTSWLFGHPGKNFVGTMLRLMSEREHLKVVADQVGRPTYCQDLAMITFNLLDQEGIFHFANSHETSWYLFAKEIHRQALELGFPLKVRSIEPISTAEYPTPAKRPGYSTLHTKKIEHLLGYPPRHWQDALRDYLIKVQTDQKRLQTSEK